MDREKIEEHLRCPICFEIPAGEIYQCKNGHQICSACCGQVATCPSCRVQFGNPKIRVRALENVLDAMDFECQFKEKGCSERIKRSRLTTHGMECQFRPFHFCKLLGFKACDFEAHRIPQLTIFHLQQTHGVIVRQTEELLICYDSFSQDILSPRIIPASLPLFGQPVLIKLEKDNYGPTFMLLNVIHDETFCSWICLYMHDSPEEAANFQFDFSISNVLGLGEDSVYKWKVVPSSFKKMEELLKNPTSRLPLSFFRDHVRPHLIRRRFGEPLRVRVTISKKGSKKPARHFDASSVQLLMTNFLLK